MHLTVNAFPQKYELKADEDGSPRLKLFGKKDAEYNDVTVWLHELDWEQLIEDLQNFRDQRNTEASQHAFKEQLQANLFHEIQH